jgi:hypothetical protein
MSGQRRGNRGANIPLSGDEITVFIGSYLFERPNATRKTCWLAIKQNFGTRIVGRELEVAELMTFKFSFKSL